MICIYSQNNTEYTKNGDAVLIPTKCEVSMTINGVWQMTLEHPYDPEERYKYIIEGAVVRCDIKCIRELPTVQQRFRIYTYTKGLHGITAIGFPIAMESTYDAPIDNLVISNKTGAQAMAALQAFTNKYTLSTDVTKTASASMANTNINNAIASGANNSFISAWGGEILYSNYDYMVKSRLGDDTAADHRIIYGRNLTNIEYNKDDSGLTTRIYPISEDGIRLNGTGYVDSAHASDYPVIHHRFMTAPYNLVDTDASSSSATAQQTRTSLAAISTAASTLSQGVDRSAYPPEYIKQQKNDIIAAVQTMALTGVVSTSLYNAAAKTIADAMAWMNDLAQPEWDWMGSYEDGWKYGDTNGYAVNQYIKIGKKWCYFGSNGNWQEPADSSNDWNWYQSTEETGKRYGDFSRYYAHNEYVFITIDGQLKQYWFNKEGWYDEDKSGDSDYGWNGSGTAEDPWWFGESSTKYLKSCWAFIDGIYYFFDEYGYYDGSTKFNDWQWDWVDDGANPWFGNPDETYAAIYLTNQWCKIDGAWYYFDNDGYAYDTNAARADVISLYTTGMAALATTVGTQSTALYDLLYSLMTSYAQSKYAQGVDMPVITIKVNMADLSKTTEYAGYENLETVKLGDSVECIDDEHDISTTNRVIGITYDVLRDYNSEVTIGSATASVASIIGNANGQAVAGGFDTSAIEAQLDALQDKVGDVVFNEISLVENGVAQFKIQAGENIYISRSGKTWTIRAAGGGDGDVNLYTGINVPDVSLGDDDDIYLKLGTTIGNRLDIPSMTSGGAYRGFNYTVDLTNKVYNFWVVFYDSWEYHGFLTFRYSGLTVGKTYRVSFNYKTDETPVLYGVGELYGATIQYTSSCIDGRNVSGMVSGGEFKRFTDTYYGNFEYQSFIEDNQLHTYTFDFVAESSTVYFGMYGDRINMNALQVHCTGIVIGEVEEANEIEDVYYKVNGNWLLYDGGETYEAGDNITIVGNTISATDTDEIAELEDVSLTNLADGEILKYNATTQKWENAEDSGGSEVEANPSGTPTDTLETIGIDGTIYEIHGGGGSGGSAYREAVLWSGSSSTSAWASPVTMSLDDDVTNYDEILVQFHDGAYGYAFVSIPTSDIPSNYAEKYFTNGSFVYTQNVSEAETGYVIVTASNEILGHTATGTTVTYTKVIGRKFGGNLSPIIYSTEEREVGVGENNKPLYQKTVVSQTLNAETGETILTGIDSLKVISIRSNKNYPSYISTYNIAGAGTEYGMVSFENGEVTLYNASRQTSIVIEAVLQYTKTADVAGSGKYNTLGVPNVHYTIDEQVIGTWLDKPLYRAVLDFSSSPIAIPNNQWLKINNTWAIQPIYGRAIITSSRACMELAVDCDDNDGLYIRSYFTYSQCDYVIIEYTKDSD